MDLDILNKYELVDYSWLVFMARPRMKIENPEDYSPIATKLDSGHFVFAGIIDPFVTLIFIAESSGTRKVFVPGRVRVMHKFMRVEISEFEVHRHFRCTNFPNMHRSNLCWQLYIFVCGRGNIF